MFSVLSGLAECPARKRRAESIPKTLIGLEIYKLDFIASNKRSNFYEKTGTFNPCKFS